MEAAISSLSYAPDALIVSDSASSDDLAPLDDTQLRLVCFFNLSGTALDVLRCIKGLTRAGQQLCYITNKTICDFFDVCRSTAQRAIRELEYWGLITVRIKHTKVGPNTRIVRFNTEQVVEFGNNTDFMDIDYEPINFKAKKPKAKAKAAKSSKVVAPDVGSCSEVAETDTVATTPMPVAAEAESVAEYVTTPSAAAVTAPVTPDPVPVPSIDVADSLETAPVATQDAVVAALSAAADSNPVQPSVAAVTTTVTPEPIPVPSSDAAASIETECAAFTPTNDATSVPVAAEAESVAEPITTPITVTVPASVPVSTPVQPIAAVVAAPFTPDPALAPSIDADDCLETAPVSTQEVVVAAPIPAVESIPVQPSATVAAPVTPDPAPVPASAVAVSPESESTASQEVLPSETMSPFARACLARMRKEKDFSPAGFVQHRIFLKQFSEGVSDEELAEYDLKRSDCVNLEATLGDVPNGIGLPAPAPVAALAAETTLPAADSANAGEADERPLPKDALMRAGNLPQASEALSLDESEDDLPENSHGTVVINADVPYIEAPMDEILAAANATSNDSGSGSTAASDPTASRDSDCASDADLMAQMLEENTELSLTEVLLRLATNQHEPSSAAQQPLSALELAQLPATDPRMVQHNQWPLRVFTAPNAAKLPIHCDLYRFDFTERVNQLRLGPVVFWDESEPHLCFDFAHMAEFLSAGHASAELNHYSWAHLHKGFEQFFRFSLLSELCYYSEDMFACPEEAPCCNVAELKKFFATHQRGMLLQMLAVSCGVTYGPYHDADNELLPWCSDSLWRSISRNMHLYPNKSPLPFLTACVRRQLVKSFADKSAYQSMLQIFTQEFLDYAQKQQWVSYFNYYGFGPEFMRFVYPADFIRLMHVDYQRCVFRLTYPMLLWRKIACVRAASGLEQCNDEENSNVAASLLVALAYDEQMQEHWGQFVSAFGSHYPFLTKLGGCAHV